jgi:hypothetical protein
MLLSSPCLHESKKELGVAESGVTVQRELAEVSRAIVLSNLTELVRGLEGIRKDLIEIHVTTKSLQDNSNNLAHSQ